jgi:hypothetical protein
MWFIIHIFISLLGYLSGANLKEPLDENSKTMVMRN